MDSLDQAIRGVTGLDKPAKDPLASAVSDVLYGSTADRASNLQMSVAANAMRQPDAEAQLQNLANRLGVPVESVRADPVEAQRRDRIGSIDFGGVASRAPVTSEFVAQNAAIASDDIENLSGLEESWKAFTSGIRKGSLQDELGPLHYKAMTGTLTPAEAIRRKELKGQMQANAVDEQVDNPLDWFLNLTGYTGRQMVSSLREGGVGALTGAVTAGGASLLTGPAAPIAVPAAAGLGARIGFVTGSTLFSYQQEAGFAFDEYENLKDENGNLLPRETAQAAAATVGLLNASLETVGELAMAKLIPGLDKLLQFGPKDAVKELLRQPTFREAITSAGRKWVKANTIEGVTEAIQELTVILGRDVSTMMADGEYAAPDRAEDVARIAQSGVEGFVGASGITAPGAGVQVYQNVRQVQKARQNQEFLQALGDGASASKVRERLPEKFRDMVAKLKENGPVENVYIPAEQFRKYFQDTGIEPEQIAQQVGARNYQEALAAGTDVVIPLEDYTTYLAATEHHAPLMMDMKLNQGDMSLREAEAFEQEQAEREAEIVEMMQASIGESEQPAYNQIRDRMVGELSTRFEPGTADAYATAFSKAIVTMAQRAGVDPLELFAQYDVRVQTPLPEILQRRGGAVDVTLDPMLDRLRTGDIPTEAQAMGPSLSEFLRDAGGLQGSDEIARLDESMARTPGQRRLMQETGMTLDAALQAAVDAGYLQDGDLTEADLLDALAQDVGGNRIFSAANEVQEVSAIRQSLVELQQYLDTLGADLSQDNETIRQLVSEASGRVLGGQQFEQASTQTETAEFKRWFGDSKVVDAQGKPLVVYHGTRSDFEAFDPQYQSSGKLGSGFYFTQSSKKANLFARVGGLSGTDAAPKVLPVYVSLQNPLVIEGEANLPVNKIDQATLKSQGYDGVILKNGDELSEIVAFEPTQIKSAIGNRGTFDPNDARILFQSVNTETPEFERWAGTDQVIESDEINDFDFNKPGPFVMRVYHGTTNEFNVFDASIKGNMEGQFGAVNYFTSSEQDARDNYAGEGPDLTNRIEQRAERLENELQDLADEFDGDQQQIQDEITRRYGEGVYSDDTMTMARNIARAELSGGQEIVMELFVKTEKPFVISDSGSPWFQFFDEAEIDALAVERVADNNGIDVDEVQASRDTYEDEISDARYEVMADEENPLINAIQTVADRYDVDASDVLGNLYELTDDGEVRHSAIENYLRSNESISFAESPDTGDLIGNQIIAEVIQELGFDSIVLKDANQRFKAMNMESGTTHVHVFDSNNTNIKSATENRGTFDPTDPNIYNQDARGFIQIAPDRRITIGLLEKANLSTFLHEMGHLHLEIMADLAEREGSSQQVKDDFAALLKWFGVNSRAEIQTVHHEMFARANEAYLMEGRAPSAELRGIFSRFRSWLTVIYRNLTALNVTLNDDVRGVFDRIYATDNEIEQAKRELDAQPLFTTAADAGLTEAEFQAYAKQVEDVATQAKEDLQTQLMREYQRENEKWWKEQTEKVRDEVTAEVDNTPVYLAFTALVNGKLPDGTPVKLSRDDLVLRKGKDFIKRLPKSRNAVYSRESGMDADSVANALGYENGDALLQDLVDMRPRNELIKAETERRMLERYGDMRMDGSITEKAMAALHNEGRAKVIASELRALNRLRRQVQPIIAARDRADRQARQTATDIPSAETFRKAARGMVEQMQIRDLNPYQYLLAQRRASRKAYEAAAKKDYQTAATEKQRELMNHYLYLEATKAKEQADKIFDFQKKFDKVSVRQKLGKAGADYLAQIDAIRERFEFKRVSLRELARRQSLADFVQQQESMGHIVNIPGVLLENAAKVNYRQLTTADLNGVYDTLRNIEHIASLKTKLLLRKEALEFDDVKSDLLGALAENWDGQTRELGTPNLVGLGVKEKGARAWRKFDAGLIKIEQLIQWFDGGKIDGPWSRYVFDLADQAQTKEYELHEKVTKTIQDLMDSMPKQWQESLTNKTAASLPGINGNLDKYTIISMAMNTGNESNYQRLRDGYSWNDTQVQAALEQMTADDWRFVQGVWDAIESLWPDIVEMETRMAGVAPPKVEPKPFVNQFGEFRGGYFPLVYDPRGSAVGEKQADATATVGEFMARSYGRASTDKGYTKQRVENFKAPVLLDFSQILTGHLHKAIKDISHREAVFGLNKILKDDEIKSALIEAVGEARYNEFNIWLQGLVMDRADVLTNGGYFGQLAMKFRTNMAIVTMGWKISTMMAQFAGFGPSMDLVKPRFMTQALVDFNKYGPFSKHKDTLTNFVFEKSGEMRFRSQTIDRDVRDALRRLQGKNSPLDTVRKSAFYLTAMADRQVTVPTWLGAYRQTLAEGLDEADAIRAGDRAVRLSQAAGGAKDLAAVQRNNEFLKLITMYYSPFSVLYARLRDVGVTTKRLKDLPRALARFTALAILPAVMGDLLAMRGPEEDEDEVWWAVRKAVLYPFAAIPLVRDASGYLEAAIIGLTDEGEMKFPPSFRLSPVVGAMDKLARLTFQRIPEAAMGERDWDDVAWESLEMSGYVLGLPTQQVRISGEFIADVLNDEAELESPQQALRDLLFRREPD